MPVHHHIKRQVFRVNQSDFSLRICGTLYLLSHICVQKPLREQFAQTKFQITQETRSVGNKIITSGYLKVQLFTKNKMGGHSTPYQVVAI